MGLAAAAAVSAVGAVAGGVIANKGASKAAQATQAASDQSAQVQREMYNQSAEALRPYQQVGLPASNAINALLGIGGTVPQQSLPTAQPTQAMPYEDAGQVQFGPMGSMINMARRMREGGIGERTVGWNGQLNPPGSMSLSGNALTNAATAQTPQQAYNDAFANYRNSTGYQFRLNQGMNAINSGYAGAGSIKSGAAMKAINDYGQGMASQEFGNYLAALGNQQSLGFSAASAQAGVGQNYANSLSNIYTNNGANQANAALAKSQNTANMIGSIAGIGANVFGRGF